MEVQLTALALFKFLCYFEITNIFVVSTIKIQ